MEPLSQPIPAPMALETAPGGFLPRFKGRAKILSDYFANQGLTQLAGMGAGFLIIHFMPVREFALYALAGSVITFFTFLSDLGSTSSLLHFYRQEGSAFDSYFAAVLSLRRAVFLLGAASVVAVFPWVAAAKGFGPAESLPVTAGMVLCVWFQINAALRVLALRLHGGYGRAYRAEVGGGLSRLFLAAGMVLSGLLRAWLGVLTSVFAAALTTGLARDPDRSRAPGSPGVDLAPYRRQVVRYLLPTLPSALYFAVQGPLIIWLSATFGSTRTIAEVAALGRLSAIFSLFSGLTGVVFLPRLARITDDRLYFRRYLQCGALLVLAVAGLLAAAAVVPRLFLLILGPAYHGLRRELFLIVLSSGLALLDGYALGINTARSWNRWQAAALFALFAVQTTAIALLPLSSTWNVLLFNVFTAGVGFATQVLFNALGFTRPRWVRWA
jgi:hypothetical protein